MKKAMKKRVRLISFLLSEMFLVRYWRIDMKLFSYVTIALVAILALVEPAFAADPAGVESSVSGMIQLAGGLTIAIAVFGGATAQGKVISAVVDAISRNPGAAGQMFLPWILALAFIESLVIFALLVAFKIVGLF